MSIDPDSMHLQELQIGGPPSSIHRLNLSGKPITDLSFLDTLPNLTYLDCSSTKLSSLKGARTQRHLYSFLCSNTPLSASQYLKIMAFSVFGRSLTEVNKITLSYNETELADRITYLIRPYLLKGYLISSLEPLTVYCPEENQEVILKQPSIPRPIQCSQNRSSDLLYSLWKRNKVVKKAKKASNMSKSSTYSNFGSPISLDLGRRSNSISILAKHL